MRASAIALLAIAGVLQLSTGCKKETLDKAVFKKAIDSYYSARKDCVWSATVKFPAQADTSNDEQTKGFDALTDAGLLTRHAAEKSRFLIGSKQVNNYDLSDQGRTAWTPDETQPGYGNFCIGHFEVTTVDDFTPNDVNDPTQYTVHYHHALTGVPPWAATPEMKTAFPKIAADMSGQRTATASVSKSSNGWEVVNVHASAPGF
jgi:hypothetical protein